ncbi:hypothetical protein PoB_000571700 [Plakobranchus ocellatus]|uniref:Uncharacterized protein n=1 Tax=Plakobranchus ocellatus TaxID=259542 RepID=A0AAV3Y9T4_9GAST|nr:hypothetical protein PoB_000571700 [Plakobranchus ocellatus]
MKRPGPDLRADNSCLVTPVCLISSGPELRPLRTRFFWPTLTKSERRIIKYILATYPQVKVLRPDCPMASGHQQRQPS